MMNAEVTGENRPAYAPIQREFVETNGYENSRRLGLCSNPRYVS